VIARLAEWARRTRRELVAVHLAIRDPRTPRHAKVLGAVVVAYAFSPIDLIPDFVPILGYLDDIIIVPVGIWLTLRLIPFEVMADARSRAAEQLQQRKPVSWVGAVFIVALWVGLSLVAASWLWSLAR
jgi:uncharacterized membrane protein YkvA (DUF1232 family)